MKRSVSIFLLVCIFTACAKAPADRGQKSTLIVAFKVHVDEQDAANMLHELFSQDQDVAIEHLYHDQRSLDEIRQKYPQRALRTPAAASGKLPLVYKVHTSMSEEVIRDLIADKAGREDIDFIQRDYQVQIHDK